MRAATTTSIQELHPEGRPTTLLALVRELGETVDDDGEVVARAVALLLGGHVRLSGTFRNEPLESFSD